MSDNVLGNRKSVAAQNEDHSGRASFRVLLLTVLVGVMLLAASCARKTVQQATPPSRPSDIKVEVRDGGPVVLTTSTAEFEISQAGFVQAFLLKDGKKLTLDEPGIGSAAGSDYLVHEGQELRFTPDFGQAKVLEAIGKLGRGKRVEIPGRPLAPLGTDIRRVLTIEAYDDFPNIALVSVDYKNVGTSDFQIDQVVVQQHWFNAQFADAKTQPYDMWSFQGSPRRKISARPGIFSPTRATPITGPESRTICSARKRRRRSTGSPPQPSRATLRR